MNSEKVSGGVKARGAPLAVLLGVVTVVGLAPLLLLGTGWLNHSADRIRAAEANALQEVARSLALDVSREIDNLATYAAGLASSPALARGDIHEFETALRHASAATGHNFILTTSELKQLVNTLAPAGTLPETRTPEEIRVVTSSGRPFVTDVRPNRFTGREVFGLRIPALVGGREYVFTIVPPESTMSRLLEDVYLRPGWRAKLVDGRGRIVARSAGDMQHNARLAPDNLLDEMALLPNGLIQSQTIDGEAADIGFQAVPGSVWRAIVWAPAKVLDAPKRSWQRLVAISSLLAVMIGLALAFGFSIAIRQPTSALVRAAQAVGDGKRVQPFKSIMREANAIGGALAMAADRIHERERHLRLVMRELSHRSKNLLAIIQAMARQSSQTTADFESFALSFDGRIAALARSQDMLVAKDWVGGDLEELVRSQVTPFLRQASSLDAEGPSLFVSPAAVQNLGRALHELATNAAKHGSLSSQLGRVDVRWQVDASARRFRFSWREGGGPEVRRSKGRGFGRIVLEKIVPASLNGAAQLEWSKEGLEWTLDAPMECIVDAA